MTKNLVIVESPAKAKTIGGFLGKDFLVKSSFGHVRDLSKKNLSVNIEKDFLPYYEITPDKVRVVNELKKLAKEAEIVWLASDEDREGEAISWHLVETLHLEEEKVKRIAFHEITRTAITEAIRNPRGIDMNLVDAQQARRVLDRLVGFELSPILWKKVKPALSAGRVQSVAVRLIVEREEEIKAFSTTTSFKVTANFNINAPQGMVVLQAELPQRFDTRQQAVQFLEKCKDASFRVGDIETRPFTKSPAPPFTTSTLQQESSRKLGLSVASTMRVAQQLYEAGKITYMRTDSVNLSSLALAAARDVITSSYGKEYVKTRQYTTRTKGAQEAHEAIRPTYLDQPTIEGDTAEKKLYELIWKRTIASQMSDALTEKTLVTIDISTTTEKFIAKGEVIRFDGFLKVYLESPDDENGEDQSSILPPLMIGQELFLKDMTATQRYSQPPARYSEATLVKKLEDLGIGRPSTYAPIISTIQKREYVEKGDKTGEWRNYEVITLKNGIFHEEVKKEKFGFTKGKLVPTDIGSLVNSFLVRHFINIMDYHFTARVEKDFDEIAQGKKVWNEMIKEFYGPFHEKVENTLNSSEKVKGEKLLGIDPVTGKNVYVKLGKYGPIAQLGETDNSVKPRFSRLKKDQSLDTLTLVEALSLFKLPRELGEFEDSGIIVGLGRFGPYIRHRNSYYSLDRTDDPYTITEERAREIIEHKRQEEKEKIIREYDGDPPVRILKGRYGPYISIGKDNYKIPRDKDPEKLTLEECRQIAQTTPASRSRKKSGNKKQGSR
ncbi:MAG: type I DNA topoisomerase [Bacteroidales bacterium]|nr:type I DNA topoisomerase [Lentimicrobiaceae bacterium]MDD5694344.1 type I DNA topoisomerase [Bacteroidales bacterium]